MKITCRQCQKEFSVRPSDIKRGRKFCSRVCKGLWQSQNTKMEKNSHWRGGIKRFKRGLYTMVKAPQHPSAYESGYILEHRLVAEKIVGRRLNASEYVHHINGCGTDNRIENLLVTNRKGEKSHAKLHYKNRAVNNLGRFMPIA